MFCLYVSYGDQNHAIIDLKSKNPFTFVTETQRVFCEIGSEFLNIICSNVWIRSLWTLQQTTPLLHLLSETSVSPPLLLTFTCSSPTLATPVDFSDSAVTVNRAVRLTIMRYNSSQTQRTELNGRAKDIRSIGASLSIDTFFKRHLCPILLRICFTLDASVYFIIKPPKYPTKNLHLKSFITFSAPVLILSQSYAFVVLHISFCFPGLSDSTYTPLASLCSVPPAIHFPRYTKSPT